MSFIAGVIKVEVIAKNVGESNDSYSIVTLLGAPTSALFKNLGSPRRTPGKLYASGIKFMSVMDEDTRDMCLGTIATIVEMVGRKYEDPNTPGVFITTFKL